MEMEKPRWPVGAFGLNLYRATCGGCPYRSARRRILHWRLAPLPFSGRGWKLRSSSQRMTRCLEKRTFDSIRTYGIRPR